MEAGSGWRQRRIKQAPGGDGHKYTGQFGGDSRLPLRPGQHSWQPHHNESTMRGNFGLASAGLGTHFGPQSTLLGRILKLGRTYGMSLDFSFLGIEQKLVAKWP